MAMQKSFWNILITLLVLSLTLYINSCASINGRSDGRGDTAAAAQKTVLLQEGLADYAGTEDTTIFITESDKNDSGVLGEVSTAQSFASSRDHRETNTFRTFGLIKFDMSDLIADFLESGENCEDKIEVQKADLQVFGKIPADGLAYMTMMNPDALNWTEAEATYLNARDRNTWPTDGSFPDYPVLNAADGGIFDARGGEVQDGISRSWIFSLETSYVKQWLCDSSKNKGMLLRYVGPNGVVRFFSSEFPRVSLRPMLIVVLKKL